MIAVGYTVKIQSFSETCGLELEEGKVGKQPPLRGAQLRTDSRRDQPSSPKNLRHLPLHTLHSTTFTLHGLELTHQRFLWANKHPVRMQTLLEGFLSQS